MFSFSQAPGTFGYDHSKYRPPRGDEFAPIQMDEFGRPDIAEEGTAADHLPQPRPPISTAHDDIRVGRRPEPPPSPGPFSQYRTGTTTTSEPVAREKLDVENLKPEVENSAGCCKCTVM